MKERTLTLLEEMLLIHSPSRHEHQMTEYLVKYLNNIGARVYLHENQAQYGGDSPVIFAEILGALDAPPVTLNAHTDVIEPNAGLTIIKDGNQWRTDGTTTLGGDDKAGLAAILGAINYLKRYAMPHRTFYLVITPGEEQGMLGARHINWEEVDAEMTLSKNMIVFDNAGRANRVAYQAPCSYHFEVTIHGRKAHAGIEPDAGVSAIQLASQIISELPLLRIDPDTTANISTIQSDFPTNVVPDRCTFTGEVRAQSQERADQVLAQYESIIQQQVGDSKCYDFKATLDYPALRSKDGGAFVQEVIEAYQAVGVQAEPQIIGGGSDANFFAAQGFNAAIVGVGMQQVHTTEEYLEIDQLLLTTEMLVHYLTQ